MSGRVSSRSLGPRLLASIELLLAHFWYFLVLGLNGVCFLGGSGLMLYDCRASRIFYKWSQCLRMNCFKWVLRHFLQVVLDLRSWVRHEIKTVLNQVMAMYSACRWRFSDQGIQSGDLKSDGSMFAAEYFLI